MSISMRTNKHTSIGMTAGTAMDWGIIAREGTLMSVRAVRELSCSGRIPHRGVGALVFLV
jgi:hypothetical protein